MENQKNEKQTAERYIAFLNKIKLQERLTNLNIRYSLRTKTYYYAPEEKKLKYGEASAEELQNQLILVCEVLNVEVAAVVSKNRKKENVAARNIFFAEIRRLYPNTSYAKMAKVFNKNHSTAIYGIKQVLTGDSYMIDIYNHYLQKSRTAF